MFTLRFAFKNIISRKSSLVIILFIAFSIALLVVANAVFDGTGNGIEKTFSTNFTGDVVVRPKTDFPMSLFGDETPVTGKLSELPRITPYTQVLSLLKTHNEIEDTTSQLTGRAILKVNDSNKAVMLFGVEGKDYLKMMTGIKVLEGTPYGVGEKGIMISTSVRSKILEDTGVELKPGDELQLISSNGTSYTIRSATVCVIYEYEVKNELQDNIVLVDPDTLRSLLGIESLTSEPIHIDENQTNLIDSDDFDTIFDDMFGETDSADEETAFAGSESSSDNSDFEEDSSVSETDIDISSLLDENESAQTTWNYIICKVSDSNKADKIVKKLNKEFKKREWNVFASSWRAAAGMSAQYIYWMRLIFNIGLILLIGTGFIVVNNTLIIAAIDRTKETGALRAIGADRNFIAVEYLFETLMLTITAGILGCILGCIGNSILVHANITFNNSYLIQLFGGTVLRTKVTLQNITSGMILSLLLAVIGWLYPVHIALDTSPVEAMAHI